ncbi:MAG: efflux RND transporter permease subunit [Oligoflexia bacterium]|nr:efflux RND transporter permease subunit [Oligoflexia bacterium]
MSLASLSIKRPIFLTSIVVVTLIVGALSLFKLGVDQFPDVTFPVVVTRVLYPGASPQEVETLIVKTIEESVSTVSGIKRLNSTAQEGLAVVVAEFSLGVDIKYAEQQVRDKVANVRNDLPDDINEPVISRVDPADSAIMRFSVTGDLPPAKLYDIAENTVKPAFEQANGVGQVDILGGRKREIHVYVDQPKLKQHEVSIQSLAQKISASAQNVPVGKVSEGKKETVFRTIGEYKTIDHIKQTVVNFFGSDVPVTIGNLAQVEDGLEDETNRSFLNGKPSIFIDVYKQSGNNTVQVAAEAVKKMDKINEKLKLIQGNLEVKLVRDGARFIRANVEDVKQTIIEGALLAVIVVFLFLGNFRSTVITGLALPNSLLGAFILMYIMGFTINVMTLLALSLAVGLLIDDAIVVRENIFRHMEMGMPAKRAAEEGTNEVTLAVVATTLTVIAVFLPVGFLSGTVGQFFKQFGLTIVFAMTISLFDALTMAPMLSAYFAGTSHGKPGKFGQALKNLSASIDRGQDRLEALYKRILVYTLNKPARILVGAFLIFIFSIGLSRSIKSTFLPNSDNGEFSVNLEMDPGTTLEQMHETTKKIEQELLSFKEIERVATNVGRRTGESNMANIYVALVNYRERDIMTNQLKALVREKLAPYKYANPKVTDVDIVGGNQRPFTLAISGDNLEELSTFVNSFSEKVKAIPGLVDVDTNYRLGKPEYQVQLIPERIERYGVLSVNAGLELRGLMDGIVAAKFREDGKEYDIRVRLKESQRDLKVGFNQTYVPNLNGNLVRLKDIANGVDTQGPTKISRFNRSRTIIISGDLAPGGALGFIRTETEKLLTEMKPPEGITYAFIGQAEDFKDLQENMLIAVTLAVTFVFLILASLYESFITPFTIMLALPLAVVGGLIGLWLFNESLNIFSMIGMIMLLGLVTKNSILLVDYALQLIRSGMSRREALMTAGVKRLRPILMTSIALIAGTLPVAMGLSEASRSRTSMGIAIIGGLISSTLLTLVVVPAAFGYIDDFRQWCVRILGGIFMPKSAKSETSRPHEGNGTQVHRANESSPMI